VDGPRSQGAYECAGGSKYEISPRRLCKTSTEQNRARRTLLRLSVHSRKFRSNFIAFFSAEFSFCACRSRWPPPLWSSGQSSWLQIQRSWFDYRRCQIFWEVVALERDTPLSAKVDINFTDKRRSLGWHSSLADSGHEVLLSVEVVKVKMNLKIISDTNCFYVE
jgi:hypothetical protein